jgi:hypothetical protein
LNKTTYENLSKKLIETVPELAPQYEKELDWWGGEEPGPHNIYGDVLNPYLITLLKSEPGPETDEVLNRIFVFLEVLSNHPDVHVPEVVGVTVIEVLLGAGLLEAARRYMGPATLQMSREIEEWKPTKESSVTSPKL